MRVRDGRDIGLQGMLDKIPEYVDKMLGDSAEEEIVQEMGGIYNNSEAIKYVANVGSQITRNSKRTDSIEAGNLAYRFGIVNSRVPNAFALPNGSIYVTLGLLPLLKSNTELANVMGHEIGHVENRDSVKQAGVDLGAQGVLYTIATFGKMLGVLDKDQRRQLKEFSLGLITNGYSQDCENGADEDGQKLATMAGWDPQGMVNLMQLFLTMEKKKPEGIEAYMRSHPYAGDRVELAQARVPSLKAALPKATQVGGEEYKGFLENVLKLSSAEMAKVPALGPSGQIVSAFGDEGLNVLEIAGLSVMGVSALVLLYIFLKKD